MNANQDIVDREYETEDFDELINDLTTEIELLNYRINKITNIDNIHHRLAEGFDVSVSFDGYKIIEFCNLDNCSQLISAELKAGIFMPSRFAVYQKSGETNIHIAFLKPTAFARLFDSNELMQLAGKLEQELYHVLDEMD